MDYEDWKFPFGKYKGRTIPEMPTTYIDWLLGEEWFFKNKGNKDWIEAFTRELKARSRSGDYKPLSEQDEEWNYKRGE